MKINPLYIQCFVTKTALNRTHTCIPIRLRGTVGLSYHEYTVWRLLEDSWYTVLKFIRSNLIFGMKVSYKVVTFSLDNHGVIEKFSTVVNSQYGNVSHIRNAG